MNKFSLSFILMVLIAGVNAPAATPRQLPPDHLPQGLSKSDWQSIQAAYEAGRHAFAQIPGGWKARNPGQQWTTTFDGRGFLALPKNGNWQWGLELRSYGFGEEQKAINGSPAMKADGQRLVYHWDESISEWWVNDQRGLEHGFTVAERPTGRDGAPLQFTMKARGTLRPKLNPDAQAVEFCDANGALVLHYAGLKVWDADGKILPARFESAELAGEQLVRVLVDERGARYPLTIDPTAQQAYFKAGNPGSSDFFGHSVAISGNTVVVGAYGEDSDTKGVNSIPNENSLDSGAAYVFVQSEGSWVQQAYLKSSRSAADDNFGYSVAISGDTVVVGTHEDVNGVPRDTFGTAYVFVRTGNAWSEQAFLQASNLGADDHFGASVAISGDTVVVGAFQEDSSSQGVNSIPTDSAPDSGAAYVFVRLGNAWTQQAYLKAANSGADDLFGYSVAIQTNTIVVGAPGENSDTDGVNSIPNVGAGNAGAAYVFVRAGNTWTQQAYLKSNNSLANDTFGDSVAISLDTLVVGASGEGFTSGAAYVFNRTGITWSQQALLKAGNPGAGDRFGFSVAIANDMVVVGAPFEGSDTQGVNTIPNDNASSSGAAYVFVRADNTWTPQAFLKSSNSQSFHLFGHSVAAIGNFVVVGAPFENSGSSGVNSTPNDELFRAGASYIFNIMPSGPDEGDVIISVSDATATETSPGPAKANFNITLSRSSTLPVSVFYETVGIGDSAEEGDDYVRVSPRRLTFSPGQTMKTISVDILNDTIMEGPEAFSVVLSSPMNAFVLEPEGIGTILDDDTPVVVPMEDGSAPVVFGSSDGDRVTVNLEGQVLRLDDIQIDENGDIALLNLTRFADLGQGPINLTIGTQKGRGGDGRTHVANINAEGVPLGNVRVIGNLSQITAGDGVVGVESLTVAGNLGPDTQGEEAVPIVFLGSVGSLTVRGEVHNVSIEIDGEAGSLRFTQGVVGDVGDNTRSSRRSEAARAPRVGGGLPFGAIQASSIKTFTAKSVKKVAVKTTKKPANSRKRSEVPTSGNLEVIRIAGNVENSSFIANGSIKVVTILGDLRADDPGNPSIISALGTLDPTKQTAAVALNVFHVRGNIENSLISVGANEFGENPDVTVANVRVGKNWTASSLVAGVIDGPENDPDGFGRNDFLIPDSEVDGFQARIGRVTIVGTTRGSAENLNDFFGIEAERIDALTIGGVNISLIKDVQDDISLDPINQDFHAVELVREQ